jgi:uncharacterized NAD(P)/FAD-binding protein YdhS
MTASLLGNLNTGDQSAEIAAPLIERAAMGLWEVRRGMAFGDYSKWEHEPERIRKAVRAEAAGAISDIAADRAELLTALRDLLAAYERADLDNDTAADAARAAISKALSN